MNQIVIVLNDRSFEYDIYTLVIAFYPGVRTSVIDPGTEPAEKPDLFVLAIFVP